MIVLADFFKDFSRGFGLSPGETLVVWWTIVIVLLAMLAYTIGRRVYRWEAARLRVRRLFAKLAEANALDPEEKDLLLRIAEVAGLENPSILFLRPSLVRQHYAALPEGPPARRRTFDRLCSKLWG